MKSVRIPAVVVGLVLLGALAGTAISQAVFSPIKAGFVDVGDVFKKVKDASQVQMDAQKQLQQLQLWVRDQASKLKAKRDELDLLDPDTQDYMDKKQKLDIDAFTLDYQEKQRKQRIYADAARKMNAVYTRIKNEAANYAMHNGLDTVIMVNAGKISAHNMDQLELLVSTRPVLYWNKSYDVTEPLIKILNAESSDTLPANPTKAGGGSSTAPDKGAKTDDGKNAAKADGTGKDG